MRQTLKDCGVQFDFTSILCNNTRAINLFKNSILQSRTKHIDARHHFLKYHVECGHIKFDFVDT